MKINIINKKIFVLILLFLLICLPGCETTKPEEVDFAMVQAVVDMIDQLPSPIELNNEDEVKNIRSVYEDLNEKEKTYVSNIDVLLAAEEEIEFLHQGVEKASLELEQARDEVIKLVPEVFTENIELPTTYQSESGTISLRWITSDPYTLHPTGLIIQGRKDINVTLTCQMTLNHQQLTFQKDVIVQKLTLRDLSKTKNKVFSYMYTGAYHGYTETDLKTIDVVNLCFAELDNGEVNVLALGTVYPILSARAASQIRVCLCITGYSSGGKPISDAAATETGRKKLASSIVNAIEKYHFDGIDMDWEYPGFNTGRPTATDRENYTKLMKEIYQQVKAKDEDYIVSGAFPSGTSNSNRYDFQALKDCMDYFHLMTYDMNISGKATHHTALSQSANSSYNCESSVRAYLNDGVRKEQLTLGLAFYGKEYRNATSLGGKAGSTKTVDYSIIHDYEINSQNGNYEVLWDSNANAPYILNHKDNTFITYDNSRSVKLKCSYAIELGLGGVMFWEYSADNTGTLLDAVYQTMRS